MSPIEGKVAIAALETAEFTDNLKEYLHAAGQTGYQSLLKPGGLYEAGRLEREHEERKKSHPDEPESAEPYGIMMFHVAVTLRCRDGTIYFDELTLGNNLEFLTCFKKQHDTDSRKKFEVDEQELHWGQFTFGESGSDAEGSEAAESSRCESTWTFPGAAVSTTGDAASNSTLDPTAAFFGPQQLRDAPGSSKRRTVSDFSFNPNAMSFVPE